MNQNIDKGKQIDAFKDERILNFRRGQQDAFESQIKSDSFKEELSDAEAQQDEMPKLEIGLKLTWHFVEYIVFIYTLFYNSSLLQNLYVEEEAIKWKQFLIINFIFIASLITLCRCCTAQMFVFILEKMINIGTVLYIIFCITKIYPANRPYLIFFVSLSIFILLSIVLYQLLHNVNIDSCGFSWFCNLILIEVIIIYHIQYFYPGHCWMAVDLGLSNIFIFVVFLIQILKEEKMSVEVKVILDLLIAILAVTIVASISQMSVFLFQSKIIT